MQNAVSGRLSGPAPGPWGQAIAARHQIQPFSARAASSLQGRRARRPSQQEAGRLAGLSSPASTPRPQQREKLSALLWGSHFDAQAKQNLRQALFRLRKVVGQDALQGDGDVVVAHACRGRMRRQPFRAAGWRGHPGGIDGSGRSLSGPVHGRHRHQRRGLERMARRGAAAAGRYGARRPGAARRTGTGGRPPGAGPESRPARRRAQQHARGRPSDDRAGAGRIGTQGRSPQALRRPGRPAPARAEHRARCRNQGARCQASRHPADRQSSARQ